MTELVVPAVRPARPFFSSGPCAKRPGWTPEALKGALVGRSHRSKPGKAKLKDAIERTKRGCGMIVSFPKGRGEVFHAGSSDWIMGLTRADDMVMQVTRNVLNRFLA
jgi:hypothetical protein